MADSERARAEGEEAARPAKRRVELDQLLQRIATHIAEVDKASATGEPQPDNAEQDMMPAAKLAEEAEEAPAARRSSGLRREPLTIEPPALRSALGAASKHAIGAPQRAPSAVEEDGGRGNDERDETSAGNKMGGPEARVTEAAQGTAVPEETPTASVGASEGPWDSATAEALTRSYEVDAALPPLRRMLEHMGGAQAPSERRGADRRLGGDTMAFAAEPSEADLDAARGRLIEAARRVETMLDRLAPREAVEMLDERFTSLEHEIARTGTQLQRLDGIEVRLGELGEKLTDEQIVALFGSLVPTAEDLTQFAEDAAGRAAERVLEAYAQEFSAQTGERPMTAGVSNASGTAINGQLTALADTLGNFMDERRRTDAGTLEALETLQLAMQHVLDRIDRVENGGAESDIPVSASSKLADAEPVSLRSDPYTRRDPGSDDLPEGAVNLTADQAVRGLEAHSYQMGAERPEEQDTIPVARGYHDIDAALQDPASRRIEGGFHAHFDGASQAPVDRQGDVSASALRADEPPPLSDRQALIANARKAAERAKAEASVAVKADAEEEAGKRQRPAKGLMPTASPATGIVRPGVLVVAIGAVLLAGYWFLIGQRHGLPRFSLPTFSERIEPAGPTTAKRSQPDVQTEQEAPATRTPAAQEGSSPASRTSNETPPEPAGTREEASAGREEPARTETTGPGMALAFGQSPATFDAVMQARERARLANLSQRAAFTAAQSHAVPQATRAVVAKDVSAIETSSVPPQPEAREPSAAAPAAPQAARQLTLPPATAGPLSLRLAAAEGDPSAQLEIATRLAEGKGVTQNFAEAANWYGRAAAQGQPIAQYRLATLYERGMGVKADREQARSLYAQAAEQGNLKAMHNLAVISASPTSGTPDYDKAAGLFTRAAGHGLADSQYNLGVLYESGLGVPKDHAAAYKWYTLAARGGDTDAARRRDMLISRLPAETLQAMDRQISVWRPAPSNEQANNARLAGNNWKQRNAEKQR